MSDELIQQLLKLPPNPCVSFRGMVAPGPVNAITLFALLPTSGDPRVASENFTADIIVSILTSSGRLIAPFSAHPAEEEVVLLPGTILMPIKSVDAPVIGKPVVLFVEIGRAEEGFKDVESYEKFVLDRVADSYARGPVHIYSPGRFSTTTSGL